MSKEVDKLRDDMGLKIDWTEMNKINAQFKRFALYEDLKALHGLVLPEIGRFELKMIGCQQKLALFEATIVKFDEIILMK